MDRVHDMESSLQVRSYFPGAVGKMVELHATYYNDYWGLDVTFETQVGRELSEFIGGFREGRDFFRVADLGRDFAGGIAIDGHDPQRGVRLRWFLVDPRFHRQGIGSGLLEQAMGFCATAGYRRIYLWTFQGLETARRLYERAGFRLVEERPVHQWGRQIQEQRFELIL
jgi:GNAT superfamily N-acetyltransferase